MKGEGCAMAIDFARALRRNMTDAERKLWRLLRGRRFEDCKFRWQLPLGPYIADFICPEGRLVIEIDGRPHSRRSVNDAARTAWLKARGYRVVRFWNSQVMNDIETVLEEIACKLGRS